MAAPKQQSKTSLVVPPQKIVDLVVPSYLKDYKGKETGFENADSSDFLVPRLALCQSLTPHRKKSDPKYIPGLEEGMFFNTVTGEIYGTSVDFIPLFVIKSRIKFLEPIGSGIDCQAQDGRTGTKYGSCLPCPHAQFSKEGDPPACTEFKGWVSLVNGQPIGVSLKSTSLKGAKQLNSKLRVMGGGLPLFCHVIRATSIEETKNTNTYNQWVLNWKAFTPEDFVNAARDFFTAMKDRGVVVDTTGESEEFDTGAM